MRNVHQDRRRYRHRWEHRGIHPAVFGGYGARPQAQGSWTAAHSARYGTVGGASGLRSQRLWQPTGSVASCLRTRSVVLPPISGYRPSGLQAAPYCRDRAAGEALRAGQQRVGTTIAGCGIGEAGAVRQGGGVHRREYTGHYGEKASHSERDTPRRQSSAAWQAGGRVRRETPAVADRQVSS